MSRRLSSPLPHQVLEELNDDPGAQVECLRALLEVQHGEGKESAQNHSGAIGHFLRAEEILNGIPKARALLGNVKTKLAASYGNQGEQAHCRDYAQDAIAIVADVPGLGYDEACARMCLGGALWSLGDSRSGKTEYEKARRIFSRIPGCEAEMAAIAQNERNLAAIVPLPDPPRAEGSIGSAITLVIVVAVLYVLFRGCS